MTDNKLMYTEVGVSFYDWVSVSCALWWYSTTVWWYSTTVCWYSTTLCWYSTTVCWYSTTVGFCSMRSVMIFHYSVMIFHYSVLIFHYSWFLFHAQCDDIPLQCDDIPLQCDDIPLQSGDRNFVFLCSVFFYLYLWNAFGCLLGKKGKLFILYNKGREGHCMTGNAPVFSIPSHRGNRPYTCRDEFQYNPPPPPFLTHDMYGWLEGWNSE